MPRFEYTARTRGGDLVTGCVEADSPAAAAAKIRADAFPLQIKLVRGRRLAPVSFIRRVSPAVLAAFTRQLRDLLKGGVPIVRALTVLSKQTENERFAATIEDLRARVQDGASLAEALAGHPEAFKGLYVSMVRAGEMGGVLEPVLERLAELLDRDTELVGRVKSALVYPAFLVAVGFGTVTFLLYAVIPKFVSLFEDMGQALPLPTRMLIGLTGFLTGPWGIVFYAVVALLVYAAVRYARTPEGRLFIDGWKLKLPILGRIQNRLIVARFARTLGTLSANGVPILAALDMAQETVGNEVLSRELEGVRKGVKDGRSLALPLSRSAIFPPMVIDMVAVGEEAGNLEDALLRVAETYEREVDVALRAAVSLLEPVLIFCMAGVVAFVVAAMLLPVFELSGLAQ